MKRQVTIIISIIIGIIIISVVSLVLLLNSKWSSEIVDLKSEIPIMENSE